MRSPRQLVGALVARFRHLPKPVVFAMATALVTVFAVAGVYAYRTWDYIEHDNDFCMSCHLMEDPFERFAQSEHRGLGCKACHKPTFVGRSRMALTQIVENPEEIEEHAEVPNEKCVSCHVDGDPEKWTLISRSLGHRVHLESEDTSLAGLRCVQCHSSGVHEFAATSRTCAQSGCHEDVEIRLGRMGDFTIHCVACHDFSRPAPAEGRLAAGESSIRLTAMAASLRPQEAECLSCHAMRLLVGDMPDDEPHGSACGACHDPHEQTTPAEAVESCASAGCHSAVDTITPMHRGLRAGLLETCTLCHAPHDSPIEEVRCVACHADGARIDRGETILPHGVDAAIRRVVARSGGRPDGDTMALRFTHDRHGEVECEACHVSSAEHGEVTAASLRDCRECHHTPGADRAPVRCSACHRSAPAESYRIRRTLDLSVGDRTGELPFTHARHQRVQCVTCHTRGLELSAAAADCSSCHVDHHRPQAVCRSCHVEAPATAHPLIVHVGCAGSGCHSRIPFEQRPNTREFCLTCHQDMVSHETGRVCSACHAMPEWRGTVSR